MPELLKIWEQILYYAVSSGKHFTQTKFNETTATIKEIRGNEMSSVEQPMYLCDVFEANGFTKGKAEGKVEGELKGKAEGKVEVAKKLLNKGFSIDDVIDLTGLSSGEIKSISMI